MKECSRTEYSLINMLTGIGGYGINSIVGFCCRIVFVRCLAADYLGINGLFSNLLTMLSLAELGIGSAITFALYKPIAEKNEDKIAALTHFYGQAYKFIGIVVALIGVLMLPFLNIIINEPPAIKENIYLIYLIYLFNTVFSYFYSYRSALLTAMQRFYLVSGYNYIVTIIQSLLQVVFLIFTREYMVYLMIQCVGGVVYNLWISNKAKKEYPYINNKNFKPLTNGEKRALFKDVKALTLYKISGVLVNNTDNIVITYFKGLQSVGVASNYVMLSSTLASLVNQIFGSLAGSFGNLNATANEQKKYELFKILNFANFWLYGWGAIGIAVVSSDLVKWFYGEGYVLEISIPIILAVNFYMVGMQQAIYTYKNTMGLFQYGKYILIFTAILNLIFDIYFGNILGVFGIYLATALARTLTNAWYEPYVVFKYGLNIKPYHYAVRYFIYLGVLIITGIVCGYICSRCSFGVIGNVCIKLLICTFVPNIVFAIVFWRTSECKYLKSTFRNILAKVKRIYK